MVKGAGCVLGEEVVVVFLVCGDCHDRVVLVVDDDVLAVETVQPPAPARPVPDSQPISLKRSWLVCVTERVSHPPDPARGDQAMTIPHALVTKQPADPSKLGGAQLKAASSNDPAKRAAMPLRIVNLKGIKQARHKPVPHVPHDRSQHPHRDIGARIGVLKHRAGTGRWTPEHCLGKV